ncbi:MAG: ADP-ribosylglycohydrolase family protein [Chloroflexi bacterium]|nr:ADP-ribosylglycohydrolase family protein [Chloroflexota bacterium]
MPKQLSLYDRVYGCLLGQALGDAFGAAGQMNCLPQPPVDDLVAPPVEHPIHGGLQAGEYTDDTIFALAILDSLLAGGKPNAASIARSFRAAIDRLGLAASKLIGPSTRAAIDAWHRGEELGRAGRFGWTNGSVMRVALVGLRYPGDWEATVEAAYESAMPTHNTDVAIASAAAIACAVSRAAAGNATVDDLIDAACMGADKGSRYGYPFIAPSVSRRIRFAVDLARANKPVHERQRDIYDLVGTGLPAYEMAAAALAHLILANGDPVQAIRLSTNTGGDTDTTAAIAGAVAGTLRGPGRFPLGWVEAVNRANRVDLADYAGRYTQLIQRDMRG